MSEASLSQRAIVPLPGNGTSPRRLAARPSKPSEPCSIESMLLSDHADAAGSAAEVVFLSRVFRPVTLQDAEALLRHEFQRVEANAIQANAHWYPLVGVMFDQATTAVMAEAFIGRLNELLRSASFGGRA